MNIYTGLLFQHGHIADPKLAMTLAGAAMADRQARSPAKNADRSEAGNGTKSERHACFRHGSIFDVCSVSLSPFR